MEAVPAKAAHVPQNVVAKEKAANPERKIPKGRPFQPRSATREKK